jgi:hypothetical protein
MPFRRSPEPPPCVEVFVHDGLLLDQSLDHVRRRRVLCAVLHSRRLATRPTPPGLPLAGAANPASEFLYMTVFAHEETEDDYRSIPNVATEIRPA